MSQLSVSMKLVQRLHRKTLEQSKVFLLVTNVVAGADSSDNINSSQVMMTQAHAQLLFFQLSLL